jgi:hypothetical protein
LGSVQCTGRALPHLHQHSHPMGERIASQAWAQLWTPTVQVGIEPPSPFVIVRHWASCLPSLCLHSLVRKDNTSTSPLGSQGFSCPRMIPRMHSVVTAASTNKLNGILPCWAGCAGLLMGGPLATHVTMLSLSAVYLFMLTCAMLAFPLSSLWSQLLRRDCSPLPPEK